MRVWAYEEKDTWIHRLSGVTKLFFLLAWILTGMLSFDTRVLLAMLAGSVLIFRVSGTDWEQAEDGVKFFFSALFLFLLAIFLADPYKGAEIYGTRSDLFHIAGKYWLTKEQIFYECNIMAKGLSVILTASVFTSATDPGELAASVNRLGIPYKIGCRMAAALRYLPERQTALRERKNVRGKSLISLPASGNGRMREKRRVMEMRGYGRHRKRTWYGGKKLTGADCAVMAVTAAVSALFLWITFQDGNRFYNPFVK